MAAMSAAAENYEPKALAADVLASIPILGPKESGDVTFNAPSKPGKYPFLCSFPGHFQAGMRGVLIVKWPGGQNPTAGNTPYRQCMTRNRFRQRRRCPAIS